MQTELAYDPELKTQMHALLQRQSVIFRNVTLSSGKQSTYYIDGRMTSLSTPGAFLAARLWLPFLRDVQAVGGLTLGADPLVGAILCLAHQEQLPLNGFLVRKEVKQHGTMKQVEGPLEPGSCVAIVEDVVTSGGSAWKAIEAVTGLGCRVARVLALVDREEGAVDFFREKGYSYHPMFRKSDFQLGSPQ